jgi:subtilisin-like proprotein convertase family protein
MGDTDYVGIPAVFIAQAQGEALAAAAQANPLAAQIRLDSVAYVFNMTDSLLCEQVQVRLNFTHAQPGDMRVTLVSPTGTRSVLQRIGANVTPVDGSWTFMSTHHFYESSQGAWHLEFSDEVFGGTGSVHDATLIVSGVAIKDSDADGLDDDWETTHFADLKWGPRDDPDNDGYSNAREQILATDPAVNENTLALDLSRWSESIVRINWPSRADAVYEILAATDPGQPFTSITNVAGGFPRTAWYGKVDSEYRFFQVREKP